jgi:hypothetical protein
VRDGKTENKGNKKMKNGILKIALAAGMMLAGAHAVNAADAAYFFRFRGAGPVAVASATANTIFADRLLDYFGFPLEDAAGLVLSPAMVQDFLLNAVVPEFPASGEAFETRFGFGWNAPQAGEIPLNALAEFFNQQST